MSIDIHPDIAIAIEYLGPPFIEELALVPEPDNAEYGALKSLKSGTRFRAAKVTPTKVGAFVTVWRRSPSGSIQPFPSEEPMDALVVTVRENRHFGFFAFPHGALVRHDILSVDGLGGKRGFRVYPEWTTTESRQAERTQRWQNNFFLELADHPDLFAADGRVG